MSSSASNRVAVIVQARMGSTRLPGKTLRTLGDRPVLDWVIERVAMAREVDEVIVATSTRPEDDAIADHLDGSDVAVVRGSADDVLARFGNALAVTEAQLIGRVTADCPFVQPELLDQAVATVRGHDYVATGLDGRFPRGFDLEFIRRSALEQAVDEATDPLEREHVTPFIVRRPERFDHVALEAPQWARRPDLRPTLDEPDDLVLLERIVDELAATPDTLSGRAVINFLDEHPDIASINQHVHHRIVT